MSIEKLIEKVLSESPLEFIGMKVGFDKKARDFKSSDSSPEEALKKQFKNQKNVKITKEVDAFNRADGGTTIKLFYYVDYETSSGQKQRALFELIRNNSNKELFVPDEGYQFNRVSGPEDSHPTAEPTFYGQESTPEKSLDKNYNIRFGGNFLKDVSIEKYKSDILKIAFTYNQKDATQMSRYYKFKKLG